MPRLANGLVETGQYQNPTSLAHFYKTFEVADLLLHGCLLVALLQANASHCLLQKTLLQITQLCTHVDVHNKIHVTGICYLVNLSLILPTSFLLLYLNSVLYVAFWKEFLYRSVVVDIKQSSL